MFRGLIVFGAGVYTGVYIAQNYEVIPVYPPSKLWQGFKEYAEQFRKD